jgi:cytochrome c
MSGRQSTNGNLGRIRQAAIFGCVLAVAGLSPAAVAADEDEALFKKQCGACHTLDVGEPRRQGPALNGIVGRTAGKVLGFPYSKGLKQADWAWTEERLDEWLANPKSVFADTYMVYKQPDAGVRGRIIGFLKTVEG